MTVRLLSASRALSRATSRTFKKFVFWVLFMAVIASIITTSIVIQLYRIIK